MYIYIYLNIYACYIYIYIARKWVHFCFGAVASGSGFEMK
jgi:hypothetical protein